MAAQDLPIQAEAAPNLSILPPPALYHPFPRIPPPAKARTPGKDARRKEAHGGAEGVGTARGKVELRKVYSSRGRPGRIVRSLLNKGPQNLQRDDKTMAIA
jgi:hypothetical protein